jgi:HK97 family phage prohead protease
MPFANYENFQDCLDKNKDKEDPKGYCAEIMRQSEEKSVSDIKFDYNFAFKTVKTEESDKEFKSGRIIEGFASIQEIDRDNEIVMMSAISDSLNDFMLNPVIRFQHTIPVGKALESRIEGDKFYIKAYITDKTEKGLEVCSLVDEGIVKSFSIAGKILKYEDKFDKELKKDIRYITKMELYEVTVCDLPANRKSFFSVVSKSIDDAYTGKMPEIKLEEKICEDKNKNVSNMEEKITEPQEIKEAKKEEPKVDIESIVEKRVKEEMKKFEESQPVRKAKMEAYDTTLENEDGKIQKFVISNIGEVVGPTSSSAQKLMPFEHDEVYHKSEIVGDTISTFDLRKGASFKEAYMEKYTYTQTGGAGTAGYALIPVYVDPEIVDRTRREIPAVELIPRKAVKGLTYDYNIISALTNAVNLAEDASLADLTDTYDRVSVSMKYTYSTGRVTGPAYAGAQGFIDLKANEVKQRTLALKRREDQLIFLGASSTYPNEFDGFVSLLTTNYTNLAGALTIASMRTEITQCHDAGGIVSVIFTTKSVEDMLKGLLMDYQRYVDTTQLNWGITKMSFDGIPVVVDRYCQSGYMYFIDMSVCFMAVLQDATYEELAKTNDSDKFTIKLYSALVCQAEAFCSYLYGIS